MRRILEVRAARVTGQGKSDTVVYREGKGGGNIVEIGDIMVTIKVNLRQNRTGVGMIIGGLERPILRIYNNFLQDIRLSSYNSGDTTNQEGCFKFGDLNHQIKSCTQIQYRTCQNYEHMHSDFANQLAQSVNPSPGGRSAPIPTPSLSSSILSCAPTGNRDTWGNVQGGN